MAIDEEFPFLEYLIVYHLTKDSTVLVLPETLQAPHLRQSPHAARLRLPNSISIGPDCRGPCHALSCDITPMRLLSIKYTAVIDFIFAPARESRDRL